MKFFARTGSRKPAARRSKKRRRGWRWVLAFFLVALPLALIAAVLAFYAVWAQTFDLKRLGTMPERNTVFDVNGNLLKESTGAATLGPPKEGLSDHGNIRVATEPITDESQ